MSANVGDLSLERLQDQLLACQRQALLGSLSGIIAHEYNNLMSPVYTRAQDAVARDDVDAMRRALTVTVRQTERALRFTRQLMEVAQGRAPSLEARRLAELVDEAITSAVRPFEKDGIELELRVPEELQIRTQPLLFEQLMLNLLLNARAAMKGRVGRLSIGASREDDVVVINVRDRGVGMSPEMLDDVINPFLAAEADLPPGDWSGIGLGLSACRMIARRHGATIRAFTNDGSGCTFQLRWPAA